MMLLAAVVAGAKEDWRGKVVDEKGEPVAYANVAVLSKVDSTVVCGAMTGEDGTFNIVTRESDGIMMVAMLGYQTVYVVPVDGMVITLRDDLAMLQGAVATAVMPKTKLTGEGLQTSVRGSVLENVGNAKDVLAKTPGIVKTANGLEVIGKGTPLVYINGHKVTDPTELDRLQSNEIQSVEVITNPGAQYDATVRSVVRIRTIRRQGDGFGFSLNASDAQSLRWSEGNDPNGALNMNYRRGGVDFFGGINYDGGSFRQISDVQQVSFGKTPAGEDWRFENEGDLVAWNHAHNLYGNAGVNWQLADNHFLGGKVEWGRTLYNQMGTIVHDNVKENGNPIDQLTTVTEDTIGDKTPYNLGANVYYNGVVGEKLGVDVNLDYYGTDDSGITASQETSAKGQDAAINASSFITGRMYAGKAVLSYPVWTGQLQFGTEETFSTRNNVYSITGVDIPGSSSEVIENNYAGFASYAFMLPKVGMFNAGIRYEYVRYAYEDALAPEDNINRNYGNWFPSFSYSNAFGPVQLMLNYSAKTNRPSYDFLSSAIRYNSRYIWQSGNAQLQPDMMRNASVAAVYKWVTLMVNYTRTDDAIMTWSSPYGSDGVILVQPRNINTPFRSMTAMVNVTPTFGPWTLNYTIGVQPQWLTINAPDAREASGIRVTRFNGKPQFVAQVNNTLNVKGNWQFELGATFLSRGYMRNVYLTDNYCDVTAAIQKAFLQDGSLVLRLEAADILGLAVQNVDTDFGNHTITQTNLMDTQRIKLSLRYNFNTAQSKYRGTGAGSDARSRM